MTSPGLALHVALNSASPTVLNALRLDYASLTDAEKADLDGAAGVVLAVLVDNEAPAAAEAAPKKKRGAS